VHKPLWSAPYRQSKNRLFHDAKRVGLRNIRSVISPPNAPLDLITARPATPIGPLSKSVSSSTSSQSKRTFRRWYRPLFVLSIGLHSLLLLVPMPDVEQPEEVVEPEDTEVIEVVTLPEVAVLPAAAELEAPPAVAPAPPKPEPPLTAPPPAPAPPMTEAPAEVPLDSLDELSTETTGDDDGLDTGNPPGPPTLAERLGDITQYTHSTDGTTIMDAYGPSGPLALWSEELSKTSSTLSPKPHRPDPAIMVVSPVCPTPLPVAEVYVGIMANPDGTTEGEPVTLLSSGYEVLNEQARELTKAHVFPATGNLEAYQVTVAVTATCP